ncbi:hypothetical protein WJX77_007920 [Trebouxia sp. C0004]
MAAGAAVQNDALQADAFKKLYPQEFFSKFIEDGIRPDGRPVGRCRPTTIGLDVVSTADSSALVKIGSTTALAGVKLEVMPPREDSPNQGQLVVQVEMTSLASSSHRPGRFSEEAISIQERISSSLDASSAVHLEELCIDPGRAVWCIYLDIYILDAAGALLDTSLLAAVACLANLRLPHVLVNDQGNVVSAEADQSRPQKKLQLHCVPISVTCGTFSGRLLVDPTSEEEMLLQTTVSTVIDGQSRLISGPSVSGGRGEADLAVICQCIETAKYRHKELSQLLGQQLEATR